MTISNHVGNISMQRKVLNTFDTSEMLEMPIKESQTAKKISSGIHKTTFGILNNVSQKWQLQMILYILFNRLWCMEHNLEALSEFFENSACFLSVNTKYFWVKESFFHETILVRSASGTYYTYYDTLNVQNEESKTKAKHLEKSYCSESKLITIVHPVPGWQLKTTFCTSAIRCGLCSHFLGKYSFFEYFYESVYFFIILFGLVAFHL